MLIIIEFNNNLFSYKTFLFKKKIMSNRNINIKIK